MRKKNIIVPQKAKHSAKIERYEGAYVKDPQVGMHNWVVSLDLNSLYPHLIMQYNISPETLIKQVKNVDVDKLLNQKFRIRYPANNSCASWDINVDVNPQAPLEETTPW